MRTIVDYTEGSTAHFIEGLKVNQSQGEKMVIFFSQIIRHDSD